MAKLKVRDDDSSDFDVGEESEDEDDFDDLEDEEDIAPAKKRSTRSSAAAKGGKKKQEKSKVVITPKVEKEEAPSRPRSTRQQAAKERMEVDDGDQEEEDDAVLPLEGLKIVASGEFESVSRKKLEEIIETLGGQKMSGVSSRTHYLIIGYKLEDGRQVTQGSKYAKAKKFGTPILTEK